MQPHLSPLAFHETMGEFVVSSRISRVFLKKGCVVVVFCAISDYSRCTV